MSSKKLSVTEPHPSVPKSGGFIGGGRGGAGNYRKYKSEDLSQGPNAIGPASRVPLAKPFKRLVPAGRGGMGNMIAESEEPIFQFDEDLIKKREFEAPVYRIGRGGAGNHFSSHKPSSSRKDSTDSSASESDRAAERPFGAIRRNSALSIFTRRSS